MGKSQMMEDMIDTVDLFDPTTAKFQTIGKLPANIGLYEPRVVFYPSDGANKQLAGSLIITGGRPNDQSDPAKKALAHTLTYNMAKKAWGKLEPMKVARASHMMVLDADNNRLVVAGGWSQFKNGTKNDKPMRPIKSAQVLDLSSSTNKWADLTDMRGERSGAASCLWMGHFLVAGGQDKNTALNTAEYYNFSRKRWVALPRMFEARAGCFAGVVADELLVVGGDSVLTGGYTQETIEMYDEDNMGWTKLSPPSKFFPELLDKAKPKKGLKFNCSRADGYGGILVPAG